jgi:hypothetical protein
VLPALFLDFRLGPPLDLKSLRRGSHFCSRIAQLSGLHQPLVLIRAQLRAEGDVYRAVTHQQANETFYLDLFGNSSNSQFTKNHGLGTILNDD